MRAVLIFVLAAVLVGTFVVESSAKRPPQPFNGANLVGLSDSYRVVNGTASKCWGLAECTTTAQTLLKKGGVSWVALQPAK